jgi:hypothetical protein
MGKSGEPKTRRVANTRLGGGTREEWSRPENGVVRRVHKGNR